MSYFDFFALFSLFSDPFFYFCLFILLASLYFHFEDKCDDSKHVIKSDFDLDESIKNNCFEGDAQKMKEFYERKF